MTRHSIERTKERAYLNEKASIKMIERAKNRGKDSSFYHSKEKKYVENHTSSEKRALIYNNYCFIFNIEGTCITMFPVPSWFGKKKMYSEKFEVRNMKKYIRYNPAVVM